MNRREYVLEMLAQYTTDPEGLMERLSDEGLLHLGYGDADVDKILEKFQHTYGNTKTTRYDRFAANRMAQKYGSQSIVGIIDALAARNGEKYAPVPRSVADLEEKIVSILSYLRKENERSETID